MAYDYTSKWSTVSGHQANILSACDKATAPFDTETAVYYYIPQNVSSCKIVLGLPLYGRSFEHTKAIGTSFDGVSNGTWEPGIYDFKSLPRTGGTEIYDESIGASYSWNSETAEIVSYDNVAVAAQKAWWIKNNTLGGAAFWESSGDKIGNESLIETMASILCLKQEPNLLN